MKLARTAWVAALAVALATPLHGAEPLEAPVVDALKAALADEYHAEAFYDAVIEKFGGVRPFTNIIEAERMHARELLAVMETYGVRAETNTLLGAKDIAATVPSTVEEACAMGVRAEIANGDLYRPLITAAAGHPDIVAVFTRLQQASDNNHLPAFQRCADGRGGGRGGPRS